MSEKFHWTKPCVLYSSLYLSYISAARPTADKKKEWGQGEGGGGGKGHKEKGDKDGKRGNGDGDE